MIKQKLVFIIISYLFLDNILFVLIAFIEAFPIIEIDLNRSCLLWARLKLRENLINNLLPFNTFLLIKTFDFALY